MAFYQPPLQTQLNDGTATATKNCAVHSLSMSIDGGTHGAVIPTVRQVRNAAGNPTLGGAPSGLSTEDYREVLEALLPASVARHYYVRPTPVVALRNDLKAGYGAVLAIDYEKIPKEYSGQPTFTGNHAIYVSGWRWINNKRQVRDRDPLFDGRCRSWGCAPDHSLLVPLEVLLDAAASYAGAPGLFAGATVMRANK